MKVTINLPTALRSHCQDQKSVPSNASNVGDALFGLAEEFPDVRSLLLDSDDRVLGYINVFVNDRNIRDLQDMETTLGEGDEILIVPALAGG